MKPLEIDFEADVPISISEYLEVKVTVMMLTNGDLAIKHHSCRSEGKEDLKCVIETEIMKSQSYHKEKMSMHAEMAESYGKILAALQREEEREVDIDEC